MTKTIKKITAIADLMGRRLVDLQSGLASVYEKWAKAPYIFTVVVPVCIYFLFMAFIASPRYESHAAITVQSQDSPVSGDAALMMLAGVGGGSSNSDAALVAEYIHSADMYQHLITELDIKGHYFEAGDFITTLSMFSDYEDELEFYRSYVLVEVDEKSQILTLKTQGFEPEYARRVSSAIIRRAEWYINSISRGLAAEQLEFIRGESNLVEARLARARLQVLEFQRIHGLLDPEAEGMAQQQIAYTLEGQISTKKTELRVLRAIMSEDAPQVRALRNELEALEAQLVEEREQLSDLSGSEVAVSDIMAEYTGLRLEVELALQAYTAAQISMEQARMDVYKQLKYLVTVQSPTLPEKKAYPKVFYNTLLLFLLLSTAFGVCKVLMSVYRELD